MSADEGKVHKLESVTQEEAPTRDESPEQGTQPVSGEAQTNKDMSKVALIVSLLSVLLLVIFFFGMNRNIAGLSEEVKDLGVLRKDVANLDQRMVKMQDEMPDQMRRMLAHDVVNEMTMKAFYLTDTLHDEALRTKMQEVLRGLKEVRDGLEQ